ncbi:patatin-like phospholipase family protein [Rubrivirga sp.]|uniref:patatin-like phospholipase family protein n=1 Tax=Rubrivirga sp. TaxID=1885344 RepID=UPI003B51D3C0
MATKRALAISGGGLHGSFAVGVLLQLRDRGVRDFDVVAGTSTGALIAPLALLGEFDRIEAAYGTADTASVYRKHSELSLALGVLGDLVAGKVRLPTSLGSLAPLRATVEQTLTDADWDRLVTLARADKKELFLTTVDLVTGELVYWTLAGPSSQAGEAHGRIIASREMLIDVMIASSTIPFASNPVVMPDHLGTHPHVDGGVRDELPAWVCVERGATELYAVVIQQDELRRDEGPFDSGQAILQRVVSLMSHEGRTTDLGTVQAAAGFSRFRRDLAERLASVPGAADLLDRVEVPEIFRRSRLEDLFVIRPSEALPGGTLDATAAEMREMIAIGRRRTDVALDAGPTLEPLVA